MKTPWPVRQRVAIAVVAGTAAQAYDAGSGKAVGAQFTVNVKDHNYQAFKAYPDGSVAFASVKSSSSTVQIARVMPCVN